MKDYRLVEHMAMEIFVCSMENDENDHRAMDLIVAAHKMGPRPMFHLAIALHVCMIQFKKFLNQSLLPEIVDELTDEICMRLKNA